MLRSPTLETMRVSAGVRRQSLGQSGMQGAMRCQHEVHKARVETGTDRRAVLDGRCCRSGRWLLANCDVDI
jgi:hypothetical protein